MRITGVLQLTLGWVGVSGALLQLKLIAFHFLRRKHVHLLCTADHDMIWRDFKSVIFQAQQYTGSVSNSDLSRHEMEIMLMVSMQCIIRS
jgi:hypothetical protein